MGRLDDLPEHIQPVARELLGESGNQRTLLSAAVVALSLATPTQRAQYRRIATGLEPLPVVNSDEQALADRVTGLEWNLARLREEFLALVKGSQVA